MPPDQAALALRCALDAFRTVIAAELDRLYALAKQLEAEPAAAVTYDPRHELPIVTPDADRLLDALRSETGSNTRTETVQTIGRL